MDLIIETDIGRDPDDFFALCYLAAAGVNIRAITITPGDPDQVAVAKLFCREVGLDIPIGSHRIRDKTSSGGIHYELLDKYKFGRKVQPDGEGDRILYESFQKYPQADLFIIGPPSNVGRFLQGEHKLNRITMQGGFLPYHLHDFSCLRLPKFEDKAWVGTFNMNGDRPGTLSLLGADAVERRFVGKNVCHTVLYTQEELKKMSSPNSRAAELFIEGMTLYLRKHSEKKFHDPTAAVCYLHPEIGQWVQGTPVKMDAGWSTQLDESNNFVLADIDRGKLWGHIYNWS